MFREAIAAITPLVLYAHVGDPGIETIDIANIATKDGFSENLIAALTGVTGGFTIGGSGPTGDIAAGTSNTSVDAGLLEHTAGRRVGECDGCADLGRRDRRGQHRRAWNDRTAVADAPIVDIDNFATAAFATPTTDGTLGRQTAIPRRWISARSRKTPACGISTSAR